MVGRRSFPFGMAYFQVRTVSFREGITTVSFMFLENQPTTVSVNLFAGIPITTSQTFHHTHHKLRIVVIQKKKSLHFLYLFGNGKPTCFCFFFRRISKAPDPGPCGRKISTWEMQKWKVVELIGLKVLPCWVTCHIVCVS